MSLFFKRTHTAVLSPNVVCSITSLDFSAQRIFRDPSLPYTALKALLSVTTEGQGERARLGPCPPLSSNNLVSGSRRWLQPPTHTTCEHSRGVAAARHRQSSNRGDSLRSKQVDTQFSALSRVHCQTPCSALTAHQPENTHAHHLPFLGFHQ